MARSLYDRFHRLYTGRITESRADGHAGSLKVRVIALVGGNRLRCAFNESHAYWYEVVFAENGGSTMRITPNKTFSAGDTKILEAVLRENPA